MLMYLAGSRKLVLNLGDEKLCTIYLFYLLLLLLSVPFPLHGGGSRFFSKVLIFDKHRKSRYFVCASPRFTCHLVLV